MASVIFGGGVSEIRGSIAGQVFGRNANGATIRNRSTPINARTSRQVEVRNNLAGVAASWRDLTDAQRDGWIAAAPSFPYTNRLGQTSQYTGQQLFNTLNMGLVSIGLGVLSSAPSPESTFGAIGTTVMDVSASEVEAQVSVPPGADWTVQAFSSGPVSAGVMRPNSVTFSLIESFAGDELTFNIFGTYTARFGPLVAGQKAFFKYEAVSQASGQRIGIGTHSAVVVA
jgi:hypothetical protein